MMRPLFVKRPYIPSPPAPDLRRLQAEFDAEGARLRILRHRVPPRPANDDHPPGLTAFERALSVYLVLSTGLTAAFALFGASWLSGS